LAHQSGHDNVTYGVADALHIPLPESKVDVVLYPWSLLSILAPHRDSGWRSVLKAVLAEATRILRPDGTIAIIETKYLHRYGPLWFDRSTVRTLCRSGHTILRENAGVWSRCA
jgi:ubiquinone/menaquinone biosynthesis C-methylase UbiE